MYWVALVALALAALSDWRSRKIPDWIPAALLLSALAAKGMAWHPASWAELLLGAGGAFLLAAALFRLGALGGGDVKLLTALGAALGARALVPFLLATGIVGGVVALWARRRGRRHGGRNEIAYAPVMLTGLLSLLPLLWLGR